MAGVVSEAVAPPKDPQMKRWKLLSVGALLAWLLLVHLLVNVWLLLLFSAIMAAAGAWLGPQFILGSSTSIHLERFIALERSTRSADAEDQLDKEIRLTIQKIVQDFVSSWYRRLSPRTAFEDEVRGVMWDLGMELKRRLRSADREQLTRKLLVLAGCHLQCYKWAKARAQGVTEPYERESLLWEAYQELSPTHPALSGSAQEVNHARWLVELLLSELVPRPQLDTRTGRHLVVELIACNVVLPLVGRMSDPDWINIVLTNIFSKTLLKMEEEKYESLAPPSIPKSLPLGPDPPPQFILPSPPSSQISGFPVVDSVEVEPEEVPDGGEESCKEKVDVFPIQYLMPPNPNSPFFLCEESEPESPMSDLGRELERPLMNSTEDLLSDCGLDSLTPAESPGAPPYNETMSGLCEESCPPLMSVTPPRPEILIESSALQSEFTSLPNNKDGCSPMDGSPLIASSPTVPIHPFSFIPLSSPDGPVLIQNLRIAGTITAREHSGTGSHPYTLYTIKYDTALDSQSLGTLQPMAYHTVNRRYREFLNLQTRLEERADLRKFVKREKLFYMLFGSPLSRSVCERRAVIGRTQSDAAPPSMAVAL
ncbi:PREDICTED: sorting nexin-19-like [Nanorana parkeri]|uniref:sorting nexin-19-like n=1 Tax=Nanorana parkeri TaxID=125878 RepID=UPI000853F4DC|nr:PREDICTED: sorting nexin-19-like [Nanorana parkeri]